MPRPPREQSPGAYHVGARGNAKSTIYFDDRDRNLFLSLLRRTAVELSWSLDAWCLLGTHFHLIVGVEGESLSRGMHRLNGVYAQWFNERYDRTGHVFERRFFSKRIEDEDQLNDTLEYILNNPVDAGLCTRPSQWRWLGGRLVAAALGDR